MIKVADTDANIDINRDSDMLGVRKLSIKKCKFCGKEFDAFGKQIYCCINHQQKYLHGAKIKKKSASSIADIQKEAEKAGLSYGEYVARMGI